MRCMGSRGAQRGAMRLIAHEVSHQGMRCARWRHHGVTCAPQEVFKEGERVRCFVIDVDQESKRVALSTADLEEIDGDMLVNRV